MKSHNVRRGLVKRAAISGVMLSVMVVSGLALPCLALPTSFEGQLEIETSAPSSKVQYLPGTVRETAGVWNLSFGVFDPSASPSVVATESIQVNWAQQQATLLDTRSGGLQPQDLGQLAHVPFSQFASRPETIGGLLFVGDRLSTDAQFLRFGTYEHRTVKVYFFRESKDVFGQILFSPEFGLPLKIDTYDASSSVRTFVKIEHPSL